MAAADEQAERKTILYGSSTEKVEQVPYWRDSASESHSASEAVPRLRNEAQRKPNLIADEPAVFPVDENPGARGVQSLHELHTFGWAAVHKHSKEIQSAAKKHALDPDLLKATCTWRTRVAGTGT